MYELSEKISVAKQELLDLIESYTNQYSAEAAFQNLGTHLDGYNYDEELFDFSYSVNDDEYDIISTITIENSKIRLCEDCEIWRGHEQIAGHYMWQTKSEILKTNGRFPKTSPWGDVKACDELFIGVFDVVTAKNSGIMVLDTFVETVLSPVAQKLGFNDNGYLCFGENSASVVERELLDKKMWNIPNTVKDKEAYEKGLERTIKRFHPEYWRSREKMLAEKETTQSLDELLHEQSDRNHTDFKAQVSPRLFITEEQAASIKTAIDFCLRFKGALTNDTQARISDIHSLLCDTYPGINKDADKGKRAASEGISKKPSLLADLHEKAKNVKPPKPVKNKAKERTD